MPNPTLETSAGRGDGPVRMRQTIERLAGALRSLGHEDDVIRFTGKWAHLGRHTVGQILDDASDLLSSLPSYPLPAENLGSAA